MSLTSGRLPALTVRLAVVAALVVGALTGVPVVAPRLAPPAAADRVCSPPDPDNGLVFCREVPTTDIVQHVTEGTYAMTEPQFAALRRLSDRARTAVAERHGITDGDVARLDWYARADLRAQLFAILTVAASRPAAQRTADEVLGLQWFADAQKRINIASATAAAREYEKFYGDLDAGMPQNACSYHPPAPFEDEYPGDVRWQGCYGPVGPLDRGPRVPSFDEFVKWGNAAALTQVTTPAAAILNGQAAGAVVGLTTGAVVAGTLAFVNAATGGSILGAFLPLTIDTTFTVVQTTLPALAQTFGRGAIEAAASTGVRLIPSGYAVGAGSLAGAAAIVVTAITLIVMATISFVEASTVHDRLLAAIIRASTTNVDPAAALISDGGRSSLLTAIVSAGVTTAFQDAAAPGAPARVVGTDEIFDVTRADGTPAPGRTDRLDLLATDPDGSGYRTGARSLRSGWFADATTTGLEPTTSLVLPLWDPNPTVSPGGVATDRDGFGYDATVTTEVVNGRRVWHAVAAGRTGYPLAGSGCDDYATDGCWTTSRLPVLGTSGAVVDRRWAEIETDVAPVLRLQDRSVGAPVQGLGAPQFWAVDANGLPITRDADGDVVTVTWTLSCSAAWCADLPPVVSPIASWSLDTPDTYTATASVRDAVGNTVQGRATYTLGNRAPAVALDPTAALDQGGDMRLTGVVTDGLHENRTLRVDWGDGTAATTVVTPPSTTSDAYALDLHHTYRRPSPTTPFTITVTASDATSSTVATRTVAVRNVAPSLGGVGGGQLTAPGPSLTGDTVTVSGAVSEPGLDDTVTLTASWYDGTVTTQTLAPSGTATRPFTVSRTVGTEHAAGGSTPLLFLAVADDSGGRTTAALDGVVLFRGPTFVSLDGSAPATEGSSVGVPLTLFDTTGAGSVTLDWGDASAADAPLPYGPSASNVSLTSTHTYVQDGTYTVTATATSSTGSAVRTRTTQVVVANASPVVSLRVLDAGGRPVEADAPPAAWSRVRLEGTVADAGAADALTAVVQWSDGTRSTVANARGTWQVAAWLGTPGRYVTQVVVADDDTTTTASATVDAVDGVSALTRVVADVDALLPTLPGAVARATRVTRTMLAGTPDAPGGAVEAVRRGDVTAAVTTLVDVVGRLRVVDRELTTDVTLVTLALARGRVLAALAAALDPGARRVAVAARATLPSAISLAYRGRTVEAASVARDAVTSLH